jgi:hypothetical protein
MKMKMKVKYIAKIKTLPLDEEVRPSMQITEEKISDIGFAYSLFTKIEFAESF